MFCTLAHQTQEYMHIDMFTDPWIIYVATKIPVCGTDGLMPIFLHNNHM